jgi:hypothetical protein
MKIVNSNKRYSGIIAGILGIAIISIFVAFALGVGGSETNFPSYVSPINAGNEVNNADVAIAKEWSEDFTPYCCGDEAVEIVYDILGLYNMPSWIFGTEKEIPSCITLYDDFGSSLYYMTVAVCGTKFTPKRWGKLTIEQCSKVRFNAKLDFVEMSWATVEGIIRDNYEDDVEQDVIDALLAANPCWDTCYTFYMFMLKDIDCDKPKSLEFCWCPTDPPFEKIDGCCNGDPCDECDCTVHVKISQQWKGCCCDATYLYILSHE